MKKEIRLSVVCYALMLLIVIGLVVFQGTMKKGLEKKLSPIANHNMQIEQAMKDAGLN